MAGRGRQLVAQWGVPGFTVLGLFLASATYLFDLSSCICGTGMKLIKAAGCMRESRSGH